MAVRATLCGCAALQQCAAVRQCVAINAAVCVRQCGSLRQGGGVRQCVAVWQCEQGQCVTVRAAVCSSVLGSVWQCGGTLPPAAQRGDSPLTTHPWVIFFYGSARGSVRLSVIPAVYGSDVQQCVRLCLAVQAAVCGSVW